jgi:hypothetical protein
MVESVEEKACRLLANGAVTLSCFEGELRATVRGDGGSYLVTLTRRGPSCSCPAWRRRCSHVLAVERVTEDSWC